MNPKSIGYLTLVLFLPVAGGLAFVDPRLALVVLFLAACAFFISQFAAIVLGESSIVKARENATIGLVASYGLTCTSLATFSLFAVFGFLAATVLLVVISYFTVQRARA